VVPLEEKGGEQLGKGVRHLYPREGCFSALLAPPGEPVHRNDVLNVRAAYRFGQQYATAGYLREADVAVSALNALNDQHTEYPLGDVSGSRVMG